jgi:diguanylate cyclase (GGDEF)-like protein
LYLLIVVVWTLLLVVVLGFIIHSDISEIRQQFRRNADALFEQLSNRVEVNSTVIEGFASLLASNQQHEWPLVRKYANRMIEYYPHIHNFEVARHVPGKDLKIFVDEMRSRIDPDFDVTSFDFTRTREWVKKARHNDYYPIIFINPVRSDNREVLGLDLGSEKKFAHALKQARKLDAPVASLPFTMLEGYRGFLLLRAIPANLSSDNHEQYAILVIKAEKLIPAQLMQRDGLSARLFHRDFGDSIEDAEIYYKPGVQASELDSKLFPLLNYQREISNPGQPFVLSLQRQIRIDDINTILIMAMLVVGILSFVAVLIFLKMHHRAEMQRLQHENRLYELANKDSLTGLVNRNFFMDRMRQVLARARRKNAKFTIVFMDMNNFKKVNDEFGHAAGDILLKDVARRFKECTREEDTIARYHGDEFVLLLEETSEHGDVSYIREKINNCFERPFMVNGQQFYTGVSVGVAVYPDDGKTAETLLQVADQKMYQDKKS